MNTPMATPELVLIDLDGTLVDSLPDIAFCVDSMLTELAMPTAGQERVRQWVGNGTDILVRRSIAGNLDGEVDEQLLARALPLFTALYAKHTSERSRVYDGVVAGLDFLRTTGAALACVTNKASAFTHKSWDFPSAGKVRAAYPAIHMFSSGVITALLTPTFQRDFEVSTSGVKADFF